MNTLKALWFIICNWGLLKDKSSIKYAAILFLLDCKPARARRSYCYN